MISINDKPGDFAKIHRDHIEAVAHTAIDEMAFAARVAGIMVAKHLANEYDMDFEEHVVLKMVQIDGKPKVEFAKGFKAGSILETL